MRHDRQLDSLPSHSKSIKYVSGYQRRICQVTVPTCVIDAPSEDGGGVLSTISPIIPAEAGSLIFSKHLQILHC